MYFIGDESIVKKNEINSRNGIVYRQSNLKSYFTCPKMFNLIQGLSPKESDSLYSSRNTAMGLLFEGYALGFKIDESSIKGVGKDTKSLLMDAASHLNKKQLKDIIGFGDMQLGDFFREGFSYFNQLWDFGDYALSGEADFFHPDFGFFDIKHTQDLYQSGWLSFASRHERLQCITYPYIRYKGTGERHTFYYIIVETKNSPPLIKVLHYTPSDDDFEWFESMLNHIHNDPTFSPKPGEYNDNCLNQMYGKAKARCKLISRCPHGQSILGGIKSIEFPNHSSRRKW